MHQKSEMAQSPGGSVCSLEENNQIGVGAKGSVSSRCDGQNIRRELFAQLKRSKKCFDLQQLEQLARSEQQYQKQHSISPISGPMPNLTQAMSNIASSSPSSLNAMKSGEGKGLVNSLLCCTGQEGEKLFE